MKPARINCQRSAAQTFGTQLEQRARTLVKHASGADDLSAGIRDEIALTLDHMERCRETRVRIARSLLRAECYTTTELMQMEQRTPRYSSDRFPEREKFQRTLFRIEQERRKLATEHESQIQQLEGRLLELLNRHKHFESA